MADKGLLLIISGPSGVGKTTIARHVEKQLDGTFSISMTTRPKSVGDQEGVDYYFVDQPRFVELRNAGKLLEWAQVFGNLYGTPRQPVVDTLSQGRLMILEIDVQGAIKVKGCLPDAYAVFIKPPSDQELLRRLRGRRRDDESTIQRRSVEARAEIARADSCGVYDAFIVNDILEQSLDEAVSLVEAAVSIRSGS